MHMTTSTRQVGGASPLWTSAAGLCSGEERALRCAKLGLRPLKARDTKKILFNLGDVNYIDSSGLGPSGQRAFTSCAESGREN